jgi:hypothetical protein
VGSSPVLSGPWQLEPLITGGAAEPTFGGTAGEGNRALVIYGIRGDMNRLHAQEIDVASLARIGPSICVP